MSFSFVIPFAEPRELRVAEVLKWAPMDLQVIGLSTASREGWDIPFEVGVIYGIHRPGTSRRPVELSVESSERRGTRLEVRVLDRSGDAEWALALSIAERSAALLGAGVIETERGSLRPGDARAASEAPPPKEPGASRVDLVFPKDAPLPRASTLTLPAPQA
ncbi:MAG: hypothetical protein KC416_07595 [Myxococcales bacterium]|nr:hypothetical protein [Myxococcales bacterium]